MSSEPDDRELEEFLAGRDPVSAAYREASRDDTAPAELDAAILLAAREAVRPPLRRRPRWLQPLALAAALVLSLGVLLNLLRDPETRSEVAPQRIEESTRQELRTETLMKDEAAAPAEAFEAVPESKQEQTFRPARAESRAARKSQGFAASPAPDFAASQSAPAPPPPPAQAMTEPAAARAAAVEAEVGREALPEEVQRQRESESPSDAVSDSRLSGDEAEVSALSPQAWIKQIREMLEQGDEQSVRRELEVFLKSHPDYALPDDLRKFAAAEE